MGPSYPLEAGVWSGEERRHSTKSNEDEGKHMERDRSPYERSIVRGGVQQEQVWSGNEVEGERERGETYWVGTGLGLTGVVSERVLTHFPDIFQHSLFAFSSIFRYVLCLFPSISLASYGQLFYFIPTSLILSSDLILPLFLFISSKLSYHTLGNETSY